MGCSSSAESEFCIGVATTSAIGGRLHQCPDAASEVFSQGPVATACLLRGGLLYVAGGNGLATLDVTGKKPRLLDRVANKAASMDSGSALHLSEQRLFVAGGDGLTMYNLIKPAYMYSPSVGALLSLKVMAKRGGASMVGTSSGDVLYVAGSNGIAIMDLSGGQVLHAGNLQPGVFRGVRSLHLALVEDRALYAAGGDGLRVFDVSKPKTPKIVGPVIEVAALTTPEHEGGAAMVVAGNRLVLSGCGGLTFFEITDALRPRKVGDSIATGAIASYESGSLVADEEMLAVAGGAGLVMISLLKPGLKLGPITTGVLCDGCSSCMVLEGDWLYLTGRAVAVLDWVLLKCALHGNLPMLDSNPTMSGSMQGMLMLYAALDKRGSREVRRARVSKRVSITESVSHGGLESVVRKSQTHAPVLLLSSGTSTAALRNEQPVKCHNSLQLAPQKVVLD